VDEIRVGNLRVVLDPAPFRASFDAVVVVLFAGERLVLVKDEGRAWEFPGGHREGHESCEETAAREVLEEAGFHIRDLRYLGYYVTPSGLVTLITCAELASLEGRGREVGPSRVGLFDELPEALSFGDGREGLFLDCALRLKASRSEDGGWVARSY
jgi:8-oxo-dGTP diphosphatase